MDFKGFFKGAVKGALGPVAAIGALAMTAGDNAVNAYNAARAGEWKTAGKEFLAFVGNAGGAALGATLGAMAATAVIAGAAAISPFVLTGVAATAATAVVTAAVVGVGIYAGSKLGDAAMTALTGYKSTETPVTGPIINPVVDKALDLWDAVTGNEAIPTQPTAPKASPATSPVALADQKVLVAGARDKARDYSLLKENPLKKNALVGGLEENISPTKSVASVDVRVSPEFAAETMASATKFMQVPAAAPTTAATSAPPRGPRVVDAGPRS